MINIDINIDTKTNEKNIEARVALLFTEPINKSKREKYPKYPQIINTEKTIYKGDIFNA